MTKLIIASCAILCISLSVSYAQSPTTQPPDSATSQTPYENKDSKFYQNNMIKVNAAELPEQIKSTLKQSAYKGWESGSLFKSPDGKEYQLEMTSGKKASVYRFDAQGNIIKRH